MCDCDHFYVTLFRNASHNIHKSNTLAAFIVQLAQDIELHPSDKWKVGLCEFTCPPPHVGTLKNILFVGETCGLIYCNLVSPNLWAINPSGV
jgi:hypothetical protein